MIIDPPSDYAFAPSFEKMGLSGYIVVNMFLPLLCITIYVFLAFFHLLNYKFNRNIKCKIKFIDNLLSKSRKYSQEVVEGFF